MAQKQGTFRAPGPSATTHNTRGYGRDETISPGAGFGAGEGGYVFTTEEGNTLERRIFRQRVWLPAAEAAGLPGLRFHELRHTAGTLAARTGATTKELMARLGHSSPRASMIYQHAAEDRDRRIGDGLDAMAEEAGLWPQDSSALTRRPFRP